MHWENGGYTPLENTASGEPQPHKGHGFSIWGSLFVPWNVAIFLFCLGAVLGGSGQQIGLPLFLSTFGNFVGAYFVVWFCSFCFTVIFGVLALILIYKGAVSDEMREWKWQPLMLGVGFFDACNGILVVYSAFLGRVPGSLQSVLTQAIIPFTLFFSKVLLNKKYSFRQLAGAGVVLFGVFFSLIPMFKHVHDGDAPITSDQKYWPFLLVLGMVPGALMNVCQEKLQDKFRAEAKGDKRFSVMYFQACESFYQMCFMTLFFWTDIVPGFGTSTDLNDWWTSYSFDWKCFFATSDALATSDRCQYCGALGTLFIMSYLISYIFGTLMTLYCSANLGSVVSSLPPVVSIIFWFAFPGVNSWAEGTPYGLGSMDGLFNIFAIPFIIAGVLLYRYHEAEDKRPDKDEAEDGTVELCWG